MFFGCHLEFDTNGDDEINKKEFDENVKNNPTLKFEDSIGPFSKYDINKDGRLSSDEIKIFLGDSEIETEVGRELKQIMKLLDEDGDRAVSYEELGNNYQYFTNKSMEIPERASSKKHRAYKKDEL